MVFYTEIISLPEKEFTVIKPIPVKVEGSDEKGWVASFEAGGQYMSGETFSSAIEELSYYIMDSVESWTRDRSDAVPMFEKKMTTLLKYVTFNVEEQK